MAQLVFPGVKWLPVSMALFLALAAGIPYLFAVAKKQVPPFSPFIRHAAAYAPQSGIFSIFITIAAFLGVLTCSLRYVIVKHRAFREKQSRNSNQAALLMGLLFNICLMYCSNYPLGLKAKTKQKWILDVLVPHYIGVVLLSLCLNAYVLMQAHFTYQQNRVSGSNIFIQSLLAVSAVVSTWSAFFPLYHSLKEQLKSLKEDENHLVSLEYKEYSFYSTICALSEWSLTFFSLLFIVSFYRDFERVSVRLHLLPKRVICDSVQLPTLSHPDEKETTKT